LLAARVHGPRQTDDGLRVTFRHRRCHGSTVRSSLTSPIAS
jgi:hypothetical protein